MGAPLLQTPKSTLTLFKHLVHPGGVHAHAPKPMRANTLQTPQNSFLKNRCTQVVSMPDGNFLDRFTCHSALQPGVFRVWCVGRWVLLFV
jgi:hypothetical protein